MSNEHEPISDRTEATARRLDCSLRLGGGDSDEEEEPSLRTAARHDAATGSTRMMADHHTPVVWTESVVSASLPNYVRHGLDGGGDEEDTTRNSDTTDSTDSTCSTVDISSSNNEEGSADRSSRMERRRRTPGRKRRNDHDHDADRETVLTKILHAMLSVAVASSSRRTNEKPHQHDQHQHDQQQQGRLAAQTTQRQERAQQELALLLILILVILAVVGFTVGIWVSWAQQQQLPADRFAAAASPEPDDDGRDTGIHVVGLARSHLGLPDTICFSASMTVNVRGQGSSTVAMKDVKVGDVIQTGPGKYEPVYSFGHRHETQPGEFVQLFTTRSRTDDHHDNRNDPAPPPLELSPQHLLLVRANTNKNKNNVGHQPPPPVPVRADTIQIGDELRRVVDDPQGQSSSWGVVTQMDRVIKPGLFMPLTSSGTLVVNGIQASAYVSIQHEAPAVVKTAAFWGFSEHQLLHWWLAPYRMFCLGGLSKFGTTNGSRCTTSRYHHQDQGDEEEEEEGILGYLLLGRSLARFVENWGPPMLHFLGAVLVLVFGLLVFLESIVGPALAPWVFLLMLGSAAVLNYRRSRNHPKMHLTKASI